MLHHDDEQRFSRHYSLESFGADGVAKLAAAKVLLVGLGGLGCPAALYLTASGVGTLGLVDDDRVTLSNLNRQILYETADIGRPKLQAARDSLLDLNPDVQIHVHETKLSSQNAADLMADYDIIMDGSDNIATRYAVNQAAWSAKKPLISAAIHGWQGQLYRFDATEKSACYACLYPTPPFQDEMPTCAESGVFSPLAGMMGCWQAAEIIKSILGLGSDNQLIRVNLRTNQTDLAQIQKDSACKVCS